MLQILEQTNLADSSGWNAIVLLLESYLLDGHELASLKVLGLVDDTVSALAELLEPLVLVERIDVFSESSSRLSNLHSSCLTRSNLCSFHFIRCFKMCL